MMRNKGQIHTSVQGCRRRINNPSPSVQSTRTSPRRLRAPIKRHAIVLLIIIIRPRRPHRRGIGVLALDAVEAERDAAVVAQVPDVRGAGAADGAIVGRLVVLDHVDVVVVLQLVDQVGGDGEPVHLVEAVVEGVLVELEAVAAVDAGEPGAGALVCVVRQVGEGEEHGRKPCGGHMGIVGVSSLPSGYEPVRAVLITFV